jgi:hypothetical protein
MTKSHVARSTGRADTTESTLSRPLRSAARMHVRSRLGTVRWRPSMCHVDTWIPPYPAHHPDAGVRTMPSSRALHVTPIAAAPLCRVITHSLCRRTEPSPPFLSPGAAHVASTQCTAIKGGPPVASRPCQRPCPSLISHHRHACLCFLPCHRCQATSPLLSPRA